MILILGGTTEGRKAAAVCDEAAHPFYYSTKGEMQQIETAHGIRITGNLDKASMLRFCVENTIRLIIDAAHPFAEALHQNVAEVSQQLSIPVLRYERTYPIQNSNYRWFDSYQEVIDYLINNKIYNLLALSGVNTIAKLKPYWKAFPCWFRILNRQDSIEIAKREGFPLDKLLFYQPGKDDTLLFKQLKPQAILTKESGESGGFKEKVKAAERSDIPVLVIKRPKLSPFFIVVNGDLGLRKQIEQLLPDFFKLKIGFTTGSCATAASKAALTTLLTGESLKEIRITLPNGESIKLPIHTTIAKEKSVSCSVVKDAGDDPDVTNGQEIVSTVRLNPSHKGVRFLQGKGVGTVTLPGLGLEIGEPAINPTPRRMIRQELFKVMRHYPEKLPEEKLRIGIDVTIAVPQGEEIAKRTFNPKLGIVGGISIIGTSGIVKPFSSDAFIASIKREFQVGKALGCEHIIINSGAKSERFIRQAYPDLKPQAFIHYGNFIGETIRIAAELGISRLTLGIMIGKAVKLAEGFLDTHSKKVVMNKEFLIQMALETGCSPQIINEMRSITLARQLWQIIPDAQSPFFALLLQKCYATCKPLFPQGELEIMLISEDGKIIK